MNNTFNISKSGFWVLLGMITLVHLLGMVFIDIMEADAAQYASISREMLESGEFLQVQHRHADYLDKPPLLFWVSAMSFKIFGVSNFTFRLPSFLFLLLGIYSTFRLGQLYYGRRTGLLAALILYSCQAYFLFSHDVRTDTILANVLIFGIWQLAVFLRERSLLNLVLGSIGIGLAMLEKGPIGFMVAFWAIGSEIVYRRSWKDLFRWEWLLGIVVLCIVLAPMSYGLYKQFGWHGLEFFYWTQSFGRITGQNVWSDDSTVFYFVHTFLWAYLPWTFLGIYGVGKSLLGLVRSKYSSAKPKELLTLGGFLITFMALSLSHYKLPHYIFVVFPLISIITARTIWEVIDTSERIKLFLVLNWIFFGSAWLAIVLLSTIVFPMHNWLVVISVLTIFGATIYTLVIKTTLVNRLVYSALLTIIGLNFMLNVHFYPTLLKFQTGSVVGKYIVAEKIPVESLFVYQKPLNSLDFCSRSVVEMVDEQFIADASGIWVFTSEIGKDKLIESGIDVKVELELDAFHVSQLSFEFLNPSTRDNALSSDYLLRIE